MLGIHSTPPVGRDSLTPEAREPLAADTTGQELLIITTLHAPDASKGTLYQFKSVWWLDLSNSKVEMKEIEEEKDEEDGNSSLILDAEKIE